MKIMTINFQKEDIARILSAKSGFPISYSKKLIEDLLDLMIEIIITNKLNLKNFGSFKILNKKPRLGRNPKTKEKFIISARKMLTFKTSRKFLLEINDN